MTNDNNDYEGIGELSKLEQVRYSVSNLFDSFGEASVGVGLLVSIGLAAPGLFVWLQFDGVVAIVGLLWAIINLLGPVKWVIEG